MERAQRISFDVEEQDHSQNMKSRRSHGSEVSSSEIASSAGRRSAQLLPLISSGQLSDDVEELHPYITTAEHIKKTITPARVVVVLLCLALSSIGVASLPHEDFLYVVSVHDIGSFQACMRYCAEARDLKFTVSEWPKGSHPICTGKDGKSTVVYQECYGHKYSDCHEVNEHQSEQSDKIVRTSCQFPVAPVIWMPCVTVSVFAMSIALVIQGLAPEVLLLGAASLLSVLGVITPGEVVAGLANGGVISLAILFPISDAITETGVLETVVGITLGEPKSLSSALLRMMFPVALVSAFLSNTATVSMMIPIVVSWSKRLDVHPGKMLMPLSFAAQLGGCLTLLGGSQCLVAKASIPASIYDMGFFDLLPIGLCNCIGTSLVITALATTRVLSPSQISSAEQSGTSPPASTDVYKLVVVVKDKKYGSLAGKTLADSGLRRLEGVVSVRHYRSSSQPNINLDAGTDTLLRASDKLEVECNERGVVALRQHPCIALGNHTDVAKLGSHRRCRSLYEGSLRAHSQLLRHCAEGGDHHEFLWQHPAFLRESLGACLISVKGPHGTARRRLQAGSVLLVEADHRFLKSRAMNWAEFFSGVSQVPGSAPPRGDHNVDFWRNILICFGMIALIGLVTADLIKLEIGGMLFLLVLLLVRGLTIPQLFDAIKPKVLLTIVGALALGSALEKVGVVNYIAGATTVAQGPIAMTAVIYCISVFLSMFINNSATIAILAPMLVSIAQEDPSLHLEPLVWALVYGAGSCFTTPLGYQTNLMVMPDGQYSFGDFVKFGSIIQVCHLILTVICTNLLSPMLV